MQTCTRPTLHRPPPLPKPAPAQTGVLVLVYGRVVDHFWVCRCRCWAAAASGAGVRGGSSTWGGCAQVRVRCRKQGAWAPRGGGGSQDVM